MNESLSLPPEPDWAAPPAAGSADGRPVASDPALRPAVRAARGAGVAAFVAAFAYVLVSLFATDLGDAAWALWLAAAVSGVATAALAYRAWRGGLPPGRIASTGCLTAVLSLGVAVSVAFGACLIALGSN